MTLLLSLMLGAWQVMFATCGELRITSLTHRDQVVNPVPIRATYLKQSCSASALQIFVDAVKQSPDQPPPNLSADLVLTPGAHQIVVQAVSSSGAVLMKAQPLTINVVSPPSTCATGNACTGVVNVWNPTGCPTAAGCAWQETVPSGNFYVDAKIYSQQPNIAAVQVSLDGIEQGQAAYGNVSFTSFHSAGIPISAGANHLVVVQAINASNLVIASATLYINAAGALTMSNIFSGIDDTNPANWRSCNPGLPCFSSLRPQPSAAISRDGQSLEFFANSGQFAQSFWFYNWVKTFKSGLPAGNAPLKYVKYEFDLHIDAPPAAVNAPQALEFHVQQSSEGLIRNFGFQDTYHGSQMWHAYDKAAEASGDSTIVRWQPVGIPFAGLNATELGANVWYHIVLEFHLDSSFSPPVIRHDAVTVYEVSPTAAPPVRLGTEYHNAHDAAPGSASPVSSAVQLDTNTNGSQYHVWIDNMTTTFMQ